MGDCTFRLSQPFSDEAGAPGVGYDLVAAGHVEASDDFHHVVFNGSLSEEELCADLFVTQTLSHESQYLNLPLGEARAGFFLGAG